jgi:hypothetical protein
MTQSCILDPKDKIVTSLDRGRKVYVIINTKK